MKKSEFYRHISIHLKKIQKKIQIIYGMRTDEIEKKLKKIQCFPKYQKSNLFLIVFSHWKLERLLYFYSIKTIDIEF